jgi:hypothetical protein
MWNGLGGFFGVLILTASSAGCGSLAPGGLAPAELGQGSDSTIENHSASISVDTEVFGIGTPRERVTEAAGPWSCSVTWLPQNPENVSFSASGTTSLELGISLVGDVAEHRWCTGHGGVNERIACSEDSVTVPVELSLETADGVFDEELDAKLELEGESSWISAAVTGDFEGSYDFESVQEFETSTSHIDLHLLTEPAALEGEVSEDRSTETPSGGGGIAVTTAEITCEALAD